MINITVTKTAGRTTEEWMFCPDIFLPNIVLIRYCKTEIPQGKRKSVILENWNYQNRINPSPCPELTDEIKADALARFVSMLKVVTWKEYKK